MFSRFTGITQRDFHISHWNFRSSVFHSPPKPNTLEQNGNTGLPEQAKFLMNQGALTSIAGVRRYNRSRSFNVRLISSGTAQTARVIAIMTPAVYLVATAHPAHMPASVSIARRSSGEILISAIKNPVINSVSVVSTYAVKEASARTFDEHKISAPIAPVYGPNFSRRKA